LRLTLTDPGLVIHRHDDRHRQPRIACQTRLRAEARASEFDAVRMVVLNHGQHEVVFEQRLERAQDGREAAGGVGGAGDDLVPVTAEAGLGDPDVGGVVLPGDEAQLDRRGRIVPLEENPAVLVDLLDPGPWQRRRTSPSPTGGQRRASSGRCSW
jgi:hypothetical protein